MLQNVHLQELRAFQYIPRMGKIHISEDNYELKQLKREGNI